MSIQMPLKRNGFYLLVFIVSLGYSCFGYGVESTENETNELQQLRLINARLALQVPNGDWRSALTVYTQDMEYREPALTIKNIDKMEDFLKHMFTHTPDYSLVIEDETLVNGMYSATWTMQGTWQGDKIKYKVPGMSVIKFKEGESLIYYQRDYFSEGEIWSKIPYIGVFARGLRSKYKRDLNYKEN